MPKRRKTSIARKGTWKVPMPPHPGMRKRNPRASIVAGMGSKYKRGKR